jgi:hypothetical protein
LLILCLWWYMILVYVLNLCSSISISILGF